MKKTFLTLLIVLTFSLFAQVSDTQAAKMSLSPATADFKSGCRNTVNIIINTEGAESNAADAFLKFNPEQVEVLAVGSGNVYRSYPGKIIGNGTIRLTAFNDTGSFNGRGLLATITFRSKPGVKEAAIDFNFSPGASTDSNVAAMNADDLLTGAYGGKYTFSTGACTTDAQPPFLEGQFPAPGAVGVPLDSKITFLVKDTGVGVDINTVKVDVNGTVYTKAGANTFGYEKTKQGYEITITPVSNFAANVPVAVTISSKDLDGNTMPDVNYRFNETQVAAAELCPELRPAAPAPQGYPLSYLISFLILLLISLGFNYYQYRKSPTYIEGHKVSFIKHVLERK